MGSCAGLRVGWCWGCFGLGWGLYVGGSGVLVQGGYFVFTVFYFSPSVPVSYFFDFFLMLSIYFADCVAAV